MRSASVPANQAPTTQPIIALDTEKPLMAELRPNPESGLAMASTAPLITDVSYPNRKPPTAPMVATVMSLACSFTGTSLF